MIWGCISLSGLVLLRKLRGTLSIAKYCGIQKDDVLTVLKAKYKRFWFQQDNTRPHVSKTTMSFFVANSVKLLDWPPYSPDLSPIQNMWSILKEILYNGQSFSTKEQLWRKIEDTYFKLSPFKYDSIRSFLISSEIVIQILLNRKLI